MKSTFPFHRRLRVFFRLIPLVFFLLLLNKESRATHAMGMDLTYEQISQDTFLITLAFYRDCAGVNAPNSATLNLRSANCNYNQNITLPRVGTGTETTPVCATLTTQCSGGTFPGSEEYIYQRTIVLPFQCTDWLISNRICCRNNGITTILNPGNQNIYVEAEINNFNANSSPTFSNNPVPFVCANQSYCFNNGAIDPEGDSLVYTLVTPRTNTGAGDTITFRAGYNRLEPIQSNPQISLDPVTGDLCMFPTDSTEIGVLAILVEEYRNGTKVGSIMRDIQLRILGCPSGNDLPQVSGIDSTSEFSIKVCANSNLTFDIYTVDQDTSQNVTMTWNQAIPGASFNFTAGTRPVGTFSWTPNNSHIRSQPHCFTVEVADDNCPFNGIQVFSYCIYVVGVRAIVDSLVDPTCNGYNDGRASAILINGILPYTYSWNDSLNQSTPSASNLSAGQYIVTGIDSTGCTTYDTVVLTDPPPLSLNMGSVSTLCDGSNEGMGIVTGINNGNAPFTYAWEVAAGQQTTDTAFNLSAGNYSVVVTDSNGCEATDSVDVLEPPPLNLAMLPVSNVSCNGLNDGEATVMVSGGTPPYQYQWGTLSQNQTTDTAINLLAGTHIVTITDTNLCTDTDSIVITEPGSAITLTLSKSNVPCFGDSTGQATVTATGGTPPYNYDWGANSGFQTTPTAVNLPVGTYTVVVTDSNNCTALPNIDITQPNAALALAPVDSFLQCNGDMNGVIGVVASGGTTPYSYLWDAAASAQTTAYASGLVAGTYQVNVTDSAGCEDSVDVDLIQAVAPLAVTIGRVNVSCNNGFDGRAFVAVTGGEAPYNIQWDSASGYQTGDTAFNLYAGTYSVTVTDSFNCQVDTFITITEPAPLLSLAIVISDVTCKGDSNGWATVNVTGGTPPYSYLWTTGQTSDTAFGLSADTFFVTVFDSNFCVTSPAIVVEQPEFNLLATGISFDARCFNDNDGYAVVSGTGGTSPYTYQWDTSASSQTTDTAFNLSAGNYTVTVTDSQLCTYDTTFTISQPSAPLQITLNTSPILCFNGSSGEAYVNITGGTQPYQILWDTNANSQTNDTATGLTSGFYTVFVTDTNQCGISDSVFVDEPAEPLRMTTSHIPVSCNGLSDGTAIASASGGTAPYSYLWGNATGSQANDTAINLSAFTYSVTVTDTNGCDTTFSVTVTEPDVLDDSILVVSNFGGSDIRCFGDSNGMAAVYPYGGTAPYQVIWDTNANSQTTDTAFNLGEGVYSVFITDANGCTTSDAISIVSPQRMSFNLVGLSNISCNGGNDGQIEVDGQGGTSPYTYAWSKIPSSTVFDTSKAVTGLDTGMYNVLLTDTNDCTYDTTYTLTQPTALTDTVISMDALCFGESTGKAYTIVGGGTPPYSYQWQIDQSSFQITDTAFNLAVGRYPLLATDDNGCEIRDTADIGEPTEVLATASGSDTICTLVPVYLKASGAGGAGGYTYTWTPNPVSNLGDSAQFFPTVTDTFFVVATDANGCQSEANGVIVYVKNVDTDFLLVDNNGDICLGDSTEVFAVHSGPYGPYQFRWDFDALTTPGPHWVSPDSSTWYTYTVTDDCLNQKSDSTLVNVFPNPEIDALLENDIGCEPLTVGFDDQVNTLPNLSYVWNFGDGTASVEKSPSHTYGNEGFETKEYEVTLTITTENGCKASNVGAESIVTVYPEPVAVAEADRTKIDRRNLKVEFTGEESIIASSYLWNFGTGDTTSEVNPTYIFPDTGVYQITLIVETENECSDTSILEVIAEPYYTLEIPNAFTPKEHDGSGGRWQDGDLSNSIFYAYTEYPEAVAQFEMIIFNRWGELIFESSSIYIGWNGHYRDKISPQEVYVFKIKVLWENGQEDEAFGDVTLFR